MTTHHATPIEFSDQPIDRNNPSHAFTAIPLSWPETFSDRAKSVVTYFDDTAFLFYYDNQYVVTDESLELTEFGDGSPENPVGFPRFVGDSLEKVENWLEAVADDYDADGDIPGWSA